MSLARNVNLSNRSFIYSLNIKHLLCSGHCPRHGSLVMEYYEPRGPTGQKQLSMVSKLRWHLS